jgi:hypothetical protein
LLMSGLRARVIHLLRTAVQLSADEWVLLAVAVAELSIARFKLQSFTARSLLEETAPTRTAPLAVNEDTSRQEALVTRVSWAIQRTAPHLPWRSDCLVQALAAQRWLRRGQVGSQLSLGVRKGSSDVIEAHAWLRCGNIVVTGGASEDYVALMQTRTYCQ